MAYRKWGLRRYRRAHKGYHKASSPMLAIVVLLLIMVVSFAVFAEAKLNPIVEQISTSRAQLLATEAISQAIADEMRNRDVSYEALISFEKDSQGKITALKSNIVKINELKSSLAINVLKKINDIEYCEFNVPIGNLINGELLSGRGPSIRLKMMPAGTVTTDITNVFTAAGINQTRHQIMVQIKVGVNILLPTSTVGTQVSTDVCIAETVIVGQVPESYTKVENADDETLNNIYRYR